MKQRRDPFKSSRPIPIYFVLLVIILVQLAAFWSCSKGGSTPVTPPPPTDTTTTPPVDTTHTGGTDTTHTGGTDTMGTTGNIYTYVLRGITQGDIRIDETNNRTVFNTSRNPDVNIILQNYNAPGAATVSSELHIKGNASVDAHGFVLPGNIKSANVDEVSYQDTSTYSYTIQTDEEMKIKLVEIFVFNGGYEAGTIAWLSAKGNPPTNSNLEGAVSKNKFIKVSFEY